MAIKLGGLHGGGCGCCNPGEPCASCSSIPLTLHMSGPTCALGAGGTLDLVWHPTGPSGGGAASWWGRLGGGTGTGIYYSWNCVGSPQLTVLDTTPGGFSPCSAFGTISSCSPFAASATFVITPGPGGTGYNCPLIGFDCDYGSFTFTLSA